MQHHILSAGLSSLLLLGALATPAASAQEEERTFQVDSAWAQLPEGQEWGAPTSWVAADGKGEIIVFVRAAPYFRVFSRSGDFLRAWGEEGSFGNAHSVTIDSQGNLWTTDAARQLVRKFNPDGELLLTLGRPDEAGDNSSEDLFNQPNHVAVAANGDIYVSDGYVNSRIVRFSADGEFLQVIGGEESSGPGQLKVPHGIAVDGQGRLLVNDSGNERVSVFGADGRFLESWPFPSRGGIAVDADGKVYVSDVNAGAVNVLRDGELLQSIAIEGRPHGLALDSDGALYVSDSLGRSVMKITAAD